MRYIKARISRFAFSLAVLGLNYSICFFNLLKHFFIRSIIQVEHLRKYVFTEITRKHRICFSSALTCNTILNSLEQLSTVFKMRSKFRSPNSHNLLGEFQTAKVLAQANFPLVEKQLLLGRGAQLFPSFQAERVQLLGPTRASVFIISVPKLRRPKEND